MFPFPPPDTDSIEFFYPHPKKPATLHTARELLVQSFALSRAIRKPLGFGEYLKIASRCFKQHCSLDKQRGKMTIVSPPGVPIIYL